jgi:hypothetical protein
VKKLNWLFIVLGFTATGCVSQKISESSARHPANLADIEVTVRGGDSASFLPKMASRNIVHDPLHYDVIVVGGGLAGLSSAVYLTDAKKKVLMLEKEPQLGGLASWSSTDSRLYDRGAAYWTDTYDEEQQILKHIGLGDFKTQQAIPDPIDSYYVRGQYYKDIWAAQTVEKLPASFALFKYELQRANKENKIPNQPFEEFDQAMELDHLNTRQWMEQMPAALEAYLANSPANSDDAKKILTRFQNERNSLRGPSGMEDVAELMDLYCRSALGTTSEFTSAMAFANFYISEIETRYTSTQGTGIAADKMFRLLSTRKNLFIALRPAPVLKIKNVDHGVEVTYNSAGTAHSVRGSYVVFSSQLKIAPELIEGLDQKSPRQAKLMRDLKYSHYSVHLIKLEGQPYRSSYDTWVHASDYTEDDFTDVILGQWMQKDMLGFEGYRDFQNDPPAKDGELSIYHPLPAKWLKTSYSDEDAKMLARKAVQRLDDLFSRLPPDLWHGPLKVKSIETSRWPFSVHIAAPGHYIWKAKILRQPFGRIFFAHSNLGTPAFEEALFRGHCAADNILKRSEPNFRREKWSRCPID